MMPQAQLFNHLKEKFTKFEQEENNFKQRNNQFVFLKTLKAELNQIRDITVCKVQQWIQNEKKRIITATNQNIQLFNDKIMRNQKCQAQIKEVITRIEIFPKLFKNDRYLNCDLLATQLFQGVEKALASFNQNLKAQYQYRFQINDIIHQQQQKQIPLSDKQKESDDLAQKLLRQKKYDKAAAKWQALIKEREKHLVQGSIDNIALLWKKDRVDCLRKAGKFQEAQQEICELLQKWNKLYGEEDQQSLDILGNYAKTLYNLGKYQEAEKKYRTLIRLRSKTLGDSHPKTISAIHNLGMNEQKRNNIQDAKEILSSAVELMKLNQSGDDLVMLDPLFNLCTTLKLCNENEKAIQNLMLFIEKAEGIGGLYGYELQFKGYKFLAEIYESEKKYREGIDAYQRAFRVAEKGFKKNDKRIKEIARSRDACKQMIPQYQLYIR